VGSFSSAICALIVASVRVSQSETEKSARKAKPGPAQRSLDEAFSVWWAAALVDIFVFVARNGSQNRIWAIWRDAGQVLCSPILPDRNNGNKPTGLPRRPGLPKRAKAALEAPPINRATEAPTGELCDRDFFFRLGRRNCRNANLLARLFEKRKSPCRNIIPSAVLGAPDALAHEPVPFIKFPPPMPTSWWPSTGYSGRPSVLGAPPACPPLSILRAVPKAQRAQKKAWRT